MLNIFKRLFGKSQAVTKYKLVTERGNGYYAFDGQVYQTDVVRSCIAPIAKSVGKLVLKELKIDQKTGETVVNPDPYMRFLLEEPNEFMSMQMMLEKIVPLVELGGNAFILIIRDDNGIPQELYLLPAMSAEVKYINGDIYLKFYMQNGTTKTYPYSDIIHIRDGIYLNDIFGEGKMAALKPLMDIVSTTDQGIVKAIKNSSVIRWLLKINQSLRPDDLKKQAEEFSDSFLAVQNGTGVAAVDTKTEAQQITPNDFVPNAMQMDRTTKRIYSLFGENEHIVQSNYTEDEYNAFYEIKVEPYAKQLADEFTRKLFTRRERGYGARIAADASGLATASMATKLGLTQLFDRGIMNTNEIRDVLNLSPTENGDKYYIRKEYGNVEDSEGGDNNED